LIERKKRALGGSKCWFLKAFGKAIVPIIGEAGSLQRYI
jgi:hypothetical protein